jgi:hypothetical protein
MSSIKVCSLWLRKSKNGTEYYSGKIGNFYVNFFFNDRKRPNSKDPDASISINPVEAKPQAQRPVQSTQVQTAQRRAPSQTFHARNESHYQDFGDPGPQEEFEPGSQLEDIPF